ncbi:hypothetical protein TpMuguga_02g00824 [Theileria parva strain Muguga]|uniref:uncharacterized protein n=1 Tax=Theileria parva strain Muguga TaxID=333668 RepID=UPI001C620D17|nr:uncharacterized protein TpMuguga_02g00824 [Theileria parva strain Muguga]EAN33109.2 hypothetical protein TpMuguga_02g00824 [Theileria parva strain Muguga]
MYAENVLRYYNNLTCRQFNMLGDYIRCYEKINLNYLLNDKSTVEDDNKQEIPDESAHSETESTNPLLKECLEKRMVNYYDNVVLSSKLKLAEEKIEKLKEEARKASEDFYSMEQIMKQIYYNDLKLSQSENEKKMEYIMKKSKENEELWEERKRLVNQILNDYTSNVNECLKIKDFYHLFQENSSNTLT